MWQKNAGMEFPHSFSTLITLGVPTFRFSAKVYFSYHHVPLTSFVYIVPEVMVATQKKRTSFLNQEMTLRTSTSTSTFRAVFFSKISRTPAQGAQRLGQHREEQGTVYRACAAVERREHLRKSLGVPGVPYPVPGLAPLGTSCGTSLVAPLLCVVVADLLF